MAPRYAAFRESSLVRPAGPLRRPLAGLAELRVTEPVLLGGVSERLRLGFPRIWFPLPLSEPPLLRGR